MFYKKKKKKMSRAQRKKQQQRYMYLGLAGLLKNSPGDIFGKSILVPKHPLGDFFVTGVTFKQVHRFF